jgi:ABC-type lipoprotein release transport system permease subunit
MNWPRTADRLAHTRAGRARRRNRFSFIRRVDARIALGVAALIIVLSVMNGFQKEVRDRMLSVISHIEVSDAGDAADWRRTASEAPQPAGSARRRSSPRSADRAATTCTASSCAASFCRKRRPSPTSPPG